MLGKRYTNDGKPTLNLNDLQVLVKEEVDQKVRDEVYRFEKIPCAICDGHNFELLSDRKRIVMGFICQW